MTNRKQLNTHSNSVFWLQRSIWLGGNSCQAPARKYSTSEKVGGFLFQIHPQRRNSEELLQESCSSQTPPFFSFCLGGHWKKFLSNLSQMTEFEGIWELASGSFPAPAESLVWILLPEIDCLVSEQTTKVAYTIQNWNHIYDSNSKWKNIFPIMNTCQAQPYTGTSKSCPTQYMDFLGQQNKHGLSELQKLDT